MHCPGAKRHDFSGRGPILRQPHVQLNAQAVNFTLAFPQADLEVPVYGTFSWYGIRMHSQGCFVGQRLCGVSDACVYITKDLIVFEYVDGCILISKEQSAITAFVQSLHNSLENFVFTVCLPSTVFLFLIFVLDLACY